MEEEAATAKNQHVELNEYTKMSLPCSKLFAALSKAQGAMGHADKNCINPHFKSRYADIASINTTSKASLAEHQLAVIQTSGLTDGRVKVMTILAHSSGEWISSELSAKPRDETPQSVGAVITYLRRYGSSAILNIATEDEDDGNAPPPRADTTKPIRDEEDFYDHTHAPDRERLIEELKRRNIEPGPERATWKLIAGTLHGKSRGELDAIIAWANQQGALAHESQVHFEKQKQGSPFNA